MAGTGKAPFVRYVAVAALAAAVVGCSSGSKPVTTPTSKPTTETVTFIIPGQTTTSTVPALPPTRAQIALNRSFLTKTGADLVKFETLTKPLVTPTNPSQFTCDNLKRVVLPKIGGPSVLQVLAKKVPDPTLQNLFVRDILTKNLLLEACSQFGAKLAAEPMQYTRNQTASLFKRLALFSIFP